MRQIDLEEAIAAHPLTVREFAMQNGCPEWRVRDSIRRGTLTADERKRPMVITEGELALTVQEWQRAIEPATRMIKPSQCSFTDGGKQFNVLGSDGRMRTYRICLTKSSADMQRREIDSIDCRRLEGAA